jgi:hypothetical protein
VGGFSGPISGVITPENPPTFWREMFQKLWLITSNLGFFVEVYGLRLLAMIFGTFSGQMWVDFLGGFHVISAWKIHLQLVKECVKKIRLITSNLRFFTKLLRFEVMWRHFWEISGQLQVNFPGRFHEESTKKIHPHLSGKCSKNHGS